MCILQIRKQNHYHHKEEQKGRKLVEIKAPTNVQHT